jgi:hypothetical protein
MRQCVEDPAKHCVAVLVAQELHGSSLPKEYFRVCAGILATMSRVVLEALAAMLEGWISVSAEGDIQPILCRGVGGSGEYWYTRTKTRDPVYVKSIRPDMNEWFRFSPVYHLDIATLRAIAALEGAGFGIKTEGQHGEFDPFGGSSASRYFEWDPTRLEWARYFIDCLKVLPAEHSGDNLPPTPAVWWQPSGLTLLVRQITFKLLRQLVHCLTEPFREVVRNI